MPKRHTGRMAAMACAATLVFTTPVWAASDAEVLQQARDRAEIEQLMWRYTRAIDTFNPDAYVAVFTPDGAFGDTKGRAALHKMVVDLKKGREARAANGAPPTGLQHYESNIYVEFVDKDHVRYHYYWQTVFLGAKRSDPPKVAAAGHGLDNLVRVDGHWLIQQRTVFAEDD